MGRLNLDTWSNIGTPDHILEWVKYGVKILFKAEPGQCEFSNRISGAREFNFVDLEIECLLQQGLIRRCYGWKPKCILPLQCVPKKDNKLRLVLDCRYVNGFICAPKFNQ